MDLQVDGKSIYSLRVVDLKQELKKRDIPFKGNANKTQLQALLIQVCHRSCGRTALRINADPYHNIELNGSPF